MFGDLLLDLSLFLSSLGSFLTRLVVLLICLDLKGSVLFLGCARRSSAASLAICLSDFLLSLSFKTFP